MAVKLTKGGNVSLTKEAPGLANITVGLGWNPRATDGKAFDLDALVFMVDASGKVTNDRDFVFFNNLESADGSVKHTGDNLDGEGEGDDEQVKIDLTKVPEAIEKIIFAVDIHQGADRGQNFGQVSDAFIRAVNDADGTEIARYDLSEDAAVETSMIFGEIYRKNGEWKLKAVEQGFADGLGPLAASYGVSV